jgi:hypothetical protein
MDFEMVVNKLKAMSKEDDETVLEAYYDLAGSVILDKVYPYDDTEGLEVPPKYVSLQVEITVYLLNKRGAEGQLAHSENGISRTYESASVPDSMLKRIVPMGKVIQ